MPRRLLRVLPPRPREFVDRSLNTVGYLLLVAYVTVVGGLAFAKLADNDSQFCEVAARRLVDKQVQIAQSNEYLTSPAGMEQTGLNTYIRQVSLPRLREEVASDRRTLPDQCEDEYRALVGGHPELRQ